MNKLDINASFDFDIKNINTDYCTYYHSVWDGEKQRIMFIGCCRFKDVLYAPDARKNRAWREHCLNLENIRITIVSTSAHVAEVMRDLARLVREHRPYCNVQGEYEGTNGRIRCTTDGMEFSTAAEACRHYDISQGAMSNHLNKRRGYGRIRNLIFERF